MATPLTDAAVAAAKAASASKERDDAIRKAHAAGCSIRSIAAAVELSSARVHQILHGR